MVEMSERVREYYKGLIALQDAIFSADDHIIALNGFPCDENLVVPLATFVEWASSSWCGELALIFPTVDNAWEALAKVESFFSFSLPKKLITVRDKKRRRFCVGNTWFTVCSSRTRELMILMFLEDSLSMVLITIPR